MLLQTLTTCSDMSSNVVSFSPPSRHKMSLRQRHDQRHVADTSATRHILSAKKKKTTRHKTTLSAKCARTPWLWYSPLIRPISCPMVVVVLHHHHHQRGRGDGERSDLIIRRRRPAIPAYSNVPPLRGCSDRSRAGRAARPSLTAPGQRSARDWDYT